MALTSTLNPRLLNAIYWLAVVAWYTNYPTRQRQAARVFSITASVVAIKLIYSLLQIENIPVFVTMLLLLGVGVLVREGRKQKAEGRKQKAEGRRQEAEGRRQKAAMLKEESLYRKLFNLFQLDSYFRRCVLVGFWILDLRLPRFARNAPQFWIGESLLVDDSRNGSIASIKQNIKQNNISSAVFNSHLGNRRLEKNKGTMGKGEFPSSPPLLVTPSPYPPLPLSPPPPLPPSSFLDQIPVGLLVLGSEAEILFCNVLGCKLLQRSEKELLGQTAFGAAWQVVQADGTSFANAKVLCEPQENLVLGVSHPNSGTRIWLLVNAQPQNYLSDNTAKVICTFSDITERYIAELTLRQSQSRLEQQNNVLLALAKSKTLAQGNLNKALDEITEVAADTLGLERVSVWLYNRDRSKIHCINLYEKTPHRHTSGIELAAIQFPEYFKALQTERTICADNAYTDPRTWEFGAAYLQAVGVTSMLDAPIWLEGEMIGVVCNEHTGNPRQWSLEEQNFVGSIADLITLAMEANQRQLAQEAFRQSEARFHNLTANVPGMIYQFLLRTDGSTTFPYVSSYCREIFELEPEEIQQNAQLAIAQIHPDDLQSFQESVSKSVQTLQPWIWEGRFITPSGRLKWLSGASQPEKLQNGEILWDGVLMDITARKQAEAALAKRERYLATLVEVQQCLLADDSDGSYYTHILEALGQASGASRVYLFQNQLDRTGRLLMSQRAEWYATGIHEIDNPALQNLSYDEFFPRWAQVLGRGEIIAGIVGEFPALEREILTCEGILSILVLPLTVNNQFWGFIGFDNCLEARSWDALEVYFLEAAAAAVALHQERALAEKALFQAKDELEIRVEQRTKALLVEIGERSAAQLALEASEARFRHIAQQEELLNRLATQIRNSLDLDTILETTVQKIQEFLQVDRCTFAWYQVGTKRQGATGVGDDLGRRVWGTTWEQGEGISQLFCSADIPASSGLQEQGAVWHIVKEAKKAHLAEFTGEFPATDTPLAKKILNLEMLIVNDVSNLQEPQLQQFLIDINTQSLLALPIQNRFGEIGVVTLHCSQPRQWQNSEVELMSAACMQLVIAIDQAYLYAQAQNAAQVAQARSHQLQKALEELQKTQAQLVQSEKMSSLGQLVAGVAHEINNPISFILGNAVHANQYILELLDILRLYQENYPEPVPPIQQLAKDIDLDFIVTDLPKILTSMQVGAQRISQIVLSLRNFSRLDEADMKCVNLHEGIDNTLLILQHRLKSSDRHSAIEIVKEYGDLPKVECYPGKLNQVFMNILSNAIDALDLAKNTDTQSVASQKVGQIRIRTEISRPGTVCVRIADNGSGMSEYVKAKIFDPFFTTKPVGSGTGLGLSISYQIVVENHKGFLNCTSEPGQGTEFCIEIPIRQSM